MCRATGYYLRALAVSLSLVSTYGGSLTVRLGDGTETTMPATARAEPSQQRYVEIDEEVADEEGVEIFALQGRFNRDDEEGAGVENKGDPTRPLKCVAWRGVEGCSPESSSKPDQAFSLPCDSPVATHLAGWCECEAGFRAREVFY